MRGWLRIDPRNSAFVARSEALERRIKLDCRKRRRKVAPINDNTRQHVLSTTENFTLNWCLTNFVFEIHTTTLIYI